MEHDLEVDFVRLLEIHIHNAHGMQCKGGVDLGGGCRGCTPPLR